MFHIFSGFAALESSLEQPEIWNIDFLTGKGPWVAFQEQPAKYPNSMVISHGKIIEVLLGDFPMPLVTSCLPFSVISNHSGFWIGQNEHFHHFHPPKLGFYWGLKIPWVVSAGFEQPAGVYIQAGTRTRSRTRTSSGICEKILLGHSFWNGMDHEILMWCVHVCTSSAIFRCMALAQNHYSHYIYIYIYMIFWQSKVVIGHPWTIPKIFG